MDLLAFAKNIADRVEAQSARAKVPVAVCVIDIHGNIVLKHRMSGAPVFSIEISERKAYTSALVGLRTADLSPLVQPGQELFPLMGLSGGRFCSMGGGAPLTSEGQLVAGVGVSGGTVEQDVAILESALREPRGHAQDRHEARGRRDPGLGRRSRQAFLWRSGLAARHRLFGRRQLPRDPVHAARLRMFDHLRQECEQQLRPAR